MNEKRKILMQEYERAIAFLNTMEVIYKEFTPQINLLKVVFSDGVIILEKPFNQLKQEQ
jgi:hypothetical protein